MISCHVEVGLRIEFEWLGRPDYRRDVRAYEFRLKNDDSDYQPMVWHDLP